MERKKERKRGGNGRGDGWEGGEVRLGVRIVNIWGWEDLKRCYTGEETSYVYIAICNKQHVVMVNY